MDTLSTARALRLRQANETPARPGLRRSTRPGARRLLCRRSPRLLCRRSPRCPI